MLSKIAISKQRLCKKIENRLPLGITHSLEVNHKFEVVQGIKAATALLQLSIFCQHQPFGLQLQSNPSDFNYNPTNHEYDTIQHGHP